MEIDTYKYFNLGKSLKGLSNKVIALLFNLLVWRKYLYINLIDNEYDVIHMLKIVLDL